MAGQGYKLPEKNDEKDGSGSGDSDEEETTQVAIAGESGKGARHSLTNRSATRRSWSATRTESTRSG